MLQLALALAIAAWSISTSVSIEGVHHDVGYPAYATVHEGHCNIVVDMRVYTDQTALNSVVLHEYGHCLNLDHYGSCNYNESIMGCPSLGYLTDYDRLMVGPKYQLIVGLWASD